MNKLETNIIKHDIDSGVVLRVEHLSKKFCRTIKRSMYYGTIDIIRSMMGIKYDTGKLRKDEFWALDDVSFELKKGETFGIIGENGSGKSTLLRLITGIFPPDKGRILIKGKVGSLIAVGAGFHPHMSGRENIFLNGTILGMSKNDINSKINDIIDFAEIGDFIDAPVSTYSSGMGVKLGFAIAVHSQPDILLVDEILSVGDISFRNKSMRKMNEYRRKANALIFVSHNLEQIRVLCDRVIVMSKGKIIFDGPTYQGIIKYENLSKDKRVNSINQNCHDELYRERWSDGDRVIINDIGILNNIGVPTQKVYVDEKLIVYIDFTIKEYADKLYFVISILNEKKDTDCIFVKSNDDESIRFTNISPGNYRVIVYFSPHNLGPGVYFINYAIANDETGEILDHGLTNKSFAVKSYRNFERGIVLSEPNWKLEKMI